MAEQSQLDGDRLALVDQLAKSMYDSLVAVVIADIKALPDNCRQSGDDSNLKNVWEEFKDQMQNEQSIYFDAFEHTIQSLCATRVSELDADRKRLLWLWSEGYLQRWADEDEVRLADLDVSHVEEEVYQHVCDVAANEPLTHELEEEINQLWPVDWPGKQFVELDNVGDPDDWLFTALGDPASVILRDLPNYEEHLAKCLAEDYFRALDEQKFDMPWDFGDDPKDPKWIAECQAGVQQEFIAFLRHWRARAQDLLDKLGPPPGGTA